MSGELRKKILIGIMAVVAGIIFFIGIFFIGKKGNLFSSTFRVLVIFNDLNGLKIGNYVRFAGVRAGVVEDISFKNDSTINVFVKIDEKYHAFIKKNDNVYIETEGLVGDKILDIKPSGHTNKMVEDGDTLNSINPFDSHRIIDKLISTNDNISSITNDMAELGKRVNEKKGILETLISDKSSADDFKEILFYLKNSSRQLSILSDRLNDISGKMAANSNNSLFQTLFMDSTLNGKVKVVIDNIKDVSEHSANITKELNKSISSPNYSNNVLGMVSKDSALANDLRKGIKDFQISTAKLKEDLEALQHSSLLRKYFKSKE